MDFGTFLLMLALSYASGVLWYDLLPGKLAVRPWRVAAYPFLGIFVAETLLGGTILGSVLNFGGIQLIPMAIGSLVAVIIDWIIFSLRNPATVAQYEPRVEAHPA